MNFCLQEFTHACGHHPLHAAPDGFSIENKGTDSMGRSLLFRCCAYQFPKFRTADTPFRNDLTQALVTQKHVFIENRTEAVMLATATTNHSHTCFLYDLLSSHRRNQVVNNGEQSGTKHHDKDPWKNEEHHWNNHFDRQFGCLFFRPLFALGSKRI